MKYLLIALVLLFVIAAIWARLAFNKGPFSLDFYGLNDNTIKEPKMAI